MRAIFIAAILLLGACIHVDGQPPPSEPPRHITSGAVPAPSPSEASAHEHAAAAHQQEYDARVPQRQAQQKTAEDERRDAAAQSLETDCSSDRAARVETMKKRMAAVDKVDDLRDWESSHCRMVDSAHEVVRTYEDSNGWLHDRVVPDRGVDRKCDAPLPRELVGHFGRFLVAQDKIPHAEMARDRHCHDADVKASTDADDFWREYGRGAPIAPGTPPPAAATDP